MHRGSLFAVLLSIFAAPSLAVPPGNYVTAMEAYKAGNYETCAVELKQLIAESPAPYTSVYYNAACCLAMAGHPDEAMIYLQKAVAHPAFRESSAISQDNDLSSLRANQNWPALLHEAEAKSRLGPVVGSGLDTDYARKHPPRIEWNDLTRRFRSHPVVLLVVVESDGSVGDVTMEKSSGSPELDGKAVEIAKGWRYVPAKADGEPFSMAARISVDFRAH